MAKPPPLSSTKSAKAGGSESSPADTPMARFRKLAAGVASVPLEKVKAEEKNLSEERKKAREKR